MSSPRTVEEIRAGEKDLEAGKGIAVDVEKP